MKLFRRIIAPTAFACLLLSHCMPSSPPHSIAVVDQNTGEFAIISVMEVGGLFPEVPRIQAAIWKNGLVALADEKDPQTINLWKRSSTAARICREEIEGLIGGTRRRELAPIDGRVFVIAVRNGVEPLCFVNGYTYLLAGLKQAPDPDRDATIRRIVVEQWSGYAHVDLSEITEFMLAWVRAMDCIELLGSGSPYEERVLSGDRFAVGYVK